ncbi:DUF6285 domain-containing protein [Tepidiforma flava]|uniref:DUF6285 domain-containing protein n=1 Tax=Tepidiforma flava TaxID=3004094 RepID=A0ABY7M7Z9_9CHLR|nr:DUF6285 domain-containing protein [Tepidiforma flava]WBL36154.1 DUF6285 domain-containing protein [Tepidiforma flava]
MGRPGPAAGGRADAARLAQVREALLRRNGDLCERIRRGDADEGPWRLAVLSHLRTVTLDKLEVSNPGLAAEYRDRA